MVLVLASAVRRSSTRRVLLDVIVHSIGLVIGSVFIGMLLGLVGSSLRPLSADPLLMIVAGAAAITYGLVDVGVFQVPALGRRWQVPRAWMGHYSFILTYWMYGVLLGVGFLTLVPVASFTVVILLEIVSASVFWGASIGLCYGLGRVVGFVLGLRYQRRCSDELAAPVVMWLVDHTLTWSKPLGRLTILVGIWFIARNLIWDIL